MGGEAKKKMMASISEKEVLQDCLVQTESWKKTLLNDEDADSDEIEEKIVERIKGLFDCSRANKEISVKEEKNLQQKLVHEEKERTTFQTRLEAYQNLMAERDLQIQSQLGQGKTELSKYINDLASKEDQTEELMRQVEHYKK